jgi:TRAP-type C4-dicarboxylate transport system substrate-binding protein
VKIAKLLLPVLMVLMLASITLIGACTQPAPAPTTSAPPTTQAPPAKPIELTYGSTNGPDHTFSQADILWIEKIEKDTGGRVKITPYWGATLLSSRENTAELIKGVADLGYLSPSTGFPIMLGTLGYPFGLPDWQTTVKIYDQMFKDFPQMDAEWTALKVMAKSVASNYHIVSTKPIRSAADFKGLRIKATGAYTSIAKELGAEGMNVPMGETYVALQKSTIDAAFAPYDTLKSFRFYEVAKYVTILDLQSAVRPSRGMNLDSYNKLPADIQKIFDNSVAYWSEEDNKARDRVNGEGYELAKANGVEFITLSAAELAKVYAAADKAMRAEAAKLDSQGLPGTKMYEEVRKLVEQNKK